MASFKNLADENKIRAARDESNRGDLSELLAGWINRAIQINKLQRMIKIASL